MYNLSAFRSRPNRISLLIVFVSVIIILLLLEFSSHLNKYLFFTSFHISTEHLRNSSSPSLCVLTRIYDRQIDYFPVFALSLRFNALNNLRLYVINTDSRTNLFHLRRTINFINILVQDMNYVTFLDLGPIPEVNQFGYGVTDQALRYIYEQQTSDTSKCDYIMFTNADNLYTKNFGVQVLPHMENKFDIIAWSFVSHHYKGNFQENFDEETNFAPKIVDDGTEKCTATTLVFGIIDLGASMYRRTFLSKHQLYFRIDNSPYDGGSDGYFVERAAKKTNMSIIVRQTIFIHQ